MEITDPATPRRLYNKPDQESCGGSNVDGRSSANSSSRSFDCTFCKRGFSNAQALGGHMNLHRKDKSRLNCTSPCAQFPFDVAVVPDRIACMSPSSRASKSLGEDEVEKKGMPGVVDAELDLELRLGR
ncbi:probable transcriptional regulator RABBIT EARS [Zingiber officinale]|uniref:C2H2-type domain-containing protein n=1 Tax=Zingiber officinale TaxID=94328 RepID=A0A8J5FQ68_ZINOF|nr:probable transcriptional regulator RABBIT EARS [Zingiber officinale]KAG6488516.1 hypothetical protein ZIOFF_049759 [Zingiber officinale]